MSATIDRASRDGEPCDDPKKPSRRGFTAKSALALLAGTTTSLTACDDGPTASTDVAASVSGAVSANHGHTAVITVAQLTAGSMLLLDT